MLNSPSLVKPIEPPRTLPPFSKDTIRELEGLLSVIKPKTKTELRRFAAAPTSAEQVRIESADKEFKVSIQMLKEKKDTDKFMEEFDRLIALAECNGDQNQLDYLRDMLRVKHQIARIHQAAEQEYLERGKDKKIKIADEKDIFTRAIKSAEDLALVIGTYKDSFELAALGAFGESNGALDIDLDLMVTQLNALRGSIELMIKSLPPQNRDQAYHDLAFKIADICQESKIKISDSESSALYKILSLVLEALGHSGHAEASLCLLVKREKERVKAREIYLSYVLENSETIMIQLSTLAVGSKEYYEKCAEIAKQALNEDDLRKP
jgi:hypothetical protein